MHLCWLRVRARVWWRELRNSCVSSRLLGPWRVLSGTLPLSSALRWPRLLRRDAFPASYSPTVPLAKHRSPQPRVVARAAVLGGIEPAARCGVCDSLFADRASGWAVYGSKRPRPRLRARRRSPRDARAVDDPSTVRREWPVRAWLECVRLLQWLERGALRDADVPFRLLRPRRVRRRRLQLPRGLPRPRMRPRSRLPQGGGASWWRRPARLLGARNVRAWRMRVL